MVEGGTIPGGEEEVTIDEVPRMSEILEQHWKAFSTDHQMVTAKERGIQDHCVLDKLGYGHLMRLQQMAGA